MKLIIKNLSQLGIKHNSFVYESNLIRSKTVTKIVNSLNKKNYIYKGKLDAPKGEKTNEWKTRDQLLFKSTIFGDDMDRPLQKEDGTWTYFAGDIAYHSHKISRKFNVLINILGADHSGYTKRIISAKQVFHIYLIRTNKRNELIDHLVKYGIDAKIHYPIPLHLQPAAKEFGYNEGDFPNTELICRSIISLPVHEFISNKQRDYVVEKIKIFFKK